MPAVSRAEIVIDKPIAVVFGELIDFGRWARWMPSMFRPVRGPQGPLSVADQVTVRLGGALPLGLRVVRVSPNAELTWRGGLPGLLVGEHAFFFDDLGDGRTRVRSEECFEGLLAHVPLLQRLVERSGEKVGASLLDALARAVA